MHLEGGWMAEHGARGARIARLTGRGRRAATAGVALLAWGLASGPALATMLLRGRIPWYAGAGPYAAGVPMSARAMRGLGMPTHRVRRGGARAPGRA